MLGLTPLVGCLADGPGEQGELGNDRFFYECAKPADAACDDLTPTGQGGGLLDIPSVALGSVFGMTTEDFDTDPASPTDRLVAQTLSSGQKAFKAEKAGVAVLVAYADAGDATDLTHVTVVEPSAAQLFQRDPNTSQWIAIKGPLTLPTGQALELRVAPVDDAGDLLAGAMDLVWAVDTSGVLSSDPGGDDNIVSISGATPGTVHLTATLGGTLEAAADLTFTGATP